MLPQVRSGLVVKKKKWRWARVGAPVKRKGDTLLCTRSDPYMAAIAEKGGGAGRKRACSLRNAIQWACPEHSQWAEQRRQERVPSRCRVVVHAGSVIEQRKCLGRWCTLCPPEKLPGASLPVCALPSACMAGAGASKGLRVRSSSVRVWSTWSSGLKVERSSSFRHLTSHAKFSVPLGLWALR